MQKQLILQQQAMFNSLGFFFTGFYFPFLIPHLCFMFSVSSVFDLCGLTPAEMLHFHPAFMCHCITHDTLCPLMDLYNKCTGFFRLSLQDHTQPVKGFMKTGKPFVIKNEK